MLPYLFRPRVKPTSSCIPKPGSSPSSFPPIKRRCAQWLANDRCNFGAFPKVKRPFSLSCLRVSPLLMSTGSGNSQNSLSNNSNLRAMDLVLAFALLLVPTCSINRSTAAPPQNKKAGCSVSVYRLQRVQSNV